MDEMDLNLLDEDKAPLTVSEDIIKYLQQIDPGVEEEEVYEKIRNFTEEQIRDILEDLLLKFENRQTLKENYGARLAAHNQRELFELAEVIPGFELDEQMYDDLTFRETLIICHITEYEIVPVGGLCLDIQKAEGQQAKERQAEDIERRLQNVFKKVNQDVVENSDIDINQKPAPGASTDEEDLEDPLKVQAERNKWKFLVHTTSQFDVNGFNAGSAITTWIDRDFHTLEELRREFYVDGSREMPENIEKSLYVGLIKKHYYVKHKSQEEDIDDRKFYSLRKAKDYISEGANFLLQRYLAISRYMGTFELSAMYINGDMCRNVYTCNGPESRIVNDVKLDVCEICRVVTEECGLEHKCMTVMTLQGQLVRQEWEGTPYILQVNPLAAIKNEKPAGNEQLLLKHTWEADMQLFSRYLDEKVKAEMKIKSYMIDHPEYKNMITDYINAILLLKPEDIIDFTMKHFLSFAPQYMPINDYFP